MIPALQHTDTESRCSLISTTRRTFVGRRRKIEIFPPFTIHWSVCVCVCVCVVLCCVCVVLCCVVRVSAADTSRRCRWAVHWLLLQSWHNGSENTDARIPQETRCKASTCYTCVCVCVIDDFIFISSQSTSVSARLMKHWDTSSWRRPEPTGSTHIVDQTV